jgi:rod shape-determining protein MreD
VAVVTAALVQTTWLDAIRMQGVLPDLTLLLVVYFAIIDGEERAMFTGVLGGIYQDVAGEAVLGHHVLCNVVAAYTVGRVSRRLVLDHPVVKVGLVFCASFLQGALFLCIEYVQSPALPALHRLFTSVVPGAFYNTLVTPIVFGILGWMFARRQEATVQGSLT